MKKKYRKIEFRPGQQIESAIKELKKYNDLVCGSFNGKMLYSDIDNLDSAFKKITGKTKLEFDKAEEKRYIKYKQEEKEYKKTIPKLTKKWIKKGNTILDKKYHKLWAKIVPIRLNDLYKGMELKASLDIIKELNNGCKLKVAKEIIEKQGHSGMSFGLVCSMIKELCNRGNEFMNYIQKQRSLT